MERILYLASSSSSRYNLLAAAEFNVKVLKQTFDESTVSLSMPLEDLVSFIALRKMEHVIMPEQTDEDIYVITADTLCSDPAGVIYGKPRDRADAMRMIRALRDGSVIATGFCLEKKRYDGCEWKTIAAHTRVVTGYCTMDLPDEWIDSYLEKTGALSAAGALVIDDFGSLFFKSMAGSYTGIIGLPLSELREALSELGFFNDKRDAFPI